MVFHSTSFRRHKRAAVTMMFQSTVPETKRNSTTIERTSSFGELVTMNACDVVSIRIRRRGRHGNRLSKLSSSSSSPSSPPSSSPPARQTTTKHGARRSITTAATAPRPLELLFVAIVVFFFAKNHIAPVHSLSAAKNEWINNSLRYYSQITRGTTTTTTNRNVAILSSSSSSSALQAQHQQENKQSPTYLKSAMENYFAREKIKNNKPQHAETIYRRLMKENSLKVLEDDCEFSHLAVPSLLLALLLQREGRIDDARVVFEGFAKVLDESMKAKEDEGEHFVSCSCSARVLQANALFEMKQNNPLKAAELIIRAVRMDRNLRPVLRWKQFREALVDYSIASRLERQELKMKRQQQKHLTLQRDGAAAV